MTFIDMIIRLTVVLWRIVLPMFPHIDTMKTRLTCYYTSLMSHQRITPNGSLTKWWGYASKWAHPP